MAKKVKVVKNSYDVCPLVEMYSLVLSNSWYSINQHCMVPELKLMSEQIASYNRF